jgi:Xaa-Pro dipeptidase
MFELPISEFKELAPIPKEYYTANRERVIKILKKQMGDKLQPGSILLLKGHDFFHQGDDDASSEPEDEPNFLYLFGNPLTYGLHGAMNIETGETSLVVESQTELDFVFHGGVSKTDDPKAHNVDRIITHADLRKELNQNPKAEVLVLVGKCRNNMTHVANMAWLEDYNVNKTALYQAICEARLVKSKYEIDIMREVCHLACKGHEYLMKKMTSGIYEFKFAELFKLRTGLAGTSKLAYGAICGAGRNGSILHYIVNKDICKEGDLFLCDMGIIGNGYCSDVTMTIPISGKFDEKQKEVYNAVLRSQRESMAMAAPGVSFPDMMKKSVLVILEELLKIGIVQGGTAEELRVLGIDRCFLPHSLGHWLGLYTHDVGCCINSDKDNCYVTTAVTVCTSLEPGMVITVEPGIYFIRSIIESFKKNEEKAKYINFEKVEEYFYIGGVRIEDDVVITETGYENLSPLPRTVEEIEEFMKNK